MYNDPAAYTGGSLVPPVLGVGAPPNLFDQGITEVTGIMGGTLVVLNATDKRDTEKALKALTIKQKEESKILEKKKDEIDVVVKNEEDEVCLSCSG